MRVGKIYKYTNKINGKSYIGQTVRPMSIRNQRHLTDAKNNDNLIFHRAIKKYGIENFKLTIIEDSIDVDILDNREKYWIKYYNTYYLNNNGYNMTEGGSWGNAPRKLSDSNIIKIKDDLLHTGILFTEIANKYGVSISAVSDINRGRTWRDIYLKYPLRDNNSHIVTEEEYNMIVDKLKNTDMTLLNIATLYSVSESIVSYINTGTYKKFVSKQDYPLRKKRVKNVYSILNPDLINRIIYSYLFSNLSIAKLSKKYMINKSTLKALITGINWKSETYMYIFPLKEYLIENQIQWNIKNDIV